MSYRYMTLAGITVLGYAATATAQETIVVAPTAPPPARVEVAPPPPASSPMTWQAGHWG